MTELGRYSMYEAYTEEKLKAENEELKKHCKLLYRSLEEVKDVNDAIMSDADDEFKAVDVSYLNGFIDATASAVNTVVGDRYKGDDNDR